MAVMTAFDVLQFPFPRWFRFEQCGGLSSGVHAVQHCHRKSLVSDRLKKTFGISNLNPIWHFFDTFWHCNLGMLKLCCFFSQEVSRPALLWVLGLLTWISQGRISQNITWSLRLKYSMSFRNMKEMDVDMKFSGGIEIYYDMIIYHFFVPVSKDHG